MHIAGVDYHDSGKSISEDAIINHDVIRNSMSIEVLIIPPGDRHRRVTIHRNEGDSFSLFLQDNLFHVTWGVENDAFFQHSYRIKNGSVVEITGVTGKERTCLYLHYDYNQGGYKQILRNI